MAHVIIHDGVIVRSSDAPFVDKEYGPSELVDYDVVWQNGGLYKAGEEPAQTAEAIFEALRAARDVRLAATDKFLLADYPISEGDLALVKTDRAALRALPEQPGAPWDGGGEATPWPDAPDILQTEQPCA